MPDASDAIRRFNRFYTREIGVLDGNLLQSGFSLAEARILYELGQTPEISATDIGEKLNLDRGYLSRMLRAFQRKRLISRKTDAGDGRRTHLSLTEKGRTTFRLTRQTLITGSRGMIADLPPSTVNTLLGAMETIQGVLKKTPPGQIMFCGVTALAIWGLSPAGRVRFTKRNTAGTKPTKLWLQKYLSSLWAATMP